jgi:hypothetical protein
LLKGALVRCDEGKAETGSQRAEGKGPPRRVNFRLNAVLLVEILTVAEIILKKRD